MPAREALDVRWALTCMELEDEVERLEAVLSPVLPVSYTHLDVYKRQVIFSCPLVKFPLVLKRLCFSAFVTAQLIPLALC